MKVTMLVENCISNDKLMAEHGLSLYIETAHHKILFDMGQTGVFAENAQTLGIDLAEVDIAVLSHGHYDHGGGLRKFLEINKKAPIYVNKHAFAPHYHGEEKYIGLDTSLQSCDRLIFTDDVYEIDEHLVLSTCNNYAKKFDLGSFGLSTMEEGGLIPDDFRHEQYLCIEENGKRVLISGCSHKGILNIVEWFQPDVLIGGFHFSKLPLDDTLAEYAKYLNEFETTYYTCHCTGEEQFRFMSEYMEQLFYLSTGESIEV